MPKNSKYIWENSPAPGMEKQENILFEFVLNEVESRLQTQGYKKTLNSGNIGGRITFSNQVCIVTTTHTTAYRHLLERFNSKDFSPLSVYSAAYDFFQVLANNCKTENKKSCNIGLIKDSIKYLEEFKPPLKSIKEIAQICNVSISYYERIFHDSFGLSPLEYRCIHKINHIKMLLQNPENTLESIANAMAYCDSGYLCRFFKLRTGMTPNEYRKIYLLQSHHSFKTTD